MEQAPTINAIVVGYDGSTGADQAVRWAVAEAELRHAPLQITHVAEKPIEEDQQDIQTQLDKAIGPSHEVAFVEGPVVGTLLEMSRTASMMVFGARGLGGFTGLLTGSVGLSVAIHASCPTVVVRGDEHAQLTGLPVAVGLDKSLDAAMAARFAFAEARMRGCELVAVRAWQPGSDPTGELESAELVALQGVLEQAGEADRRVSATSHLVDERPVKALIKASSHAQLMVVGSRGAGGFKGLLLGSVGQKLLHHAQCPVAVVR